MRDKLINRVELDDNDDADSRLKSAFGVEFTDYLHNADYTLTAAQAATLEHSGVLVTGNSVLVNASIDPVDED